MITSDRHSRSLGERGAAACAAAARGSLLTAAVLLPWSFGSVDAFSQYLMFVFLLFAELACILRLMLMPPIGRVIPWTAWPVVLLILMGGLQSAEIGAGRVQQLSPQAMRLRTELLPSDEERARTAIDLPSPAAARFTLSVYAPATRKETALLAAGLAVLLIACQIFTTPRDVLWLATTLALNGAAIAYFGLMQKLSWNGQLYWTVPIEGTTPFGPFVNRNGAGGYLTLCLAGSIPLLMWMLGSFRTGTDTGRPGPAMAFPTRRFRVPREVIWLGLAATLVLLLGGILASMSRGAWLGAVCGTAAALLWTGQLWLRRGNLMWMAAALAIAAGMLSWLSLQTELGERLSSLSDAAQGLDTRWLLWQDVVRMIPDYWQVGSGLGTFGFLQPQYQTQTMRFWFDQAENLFLQTFVEAGVLGGLLLIGMVMAALLSLLPLWRSPDPHAATMAGFVLFAIVSQTACANFDFSLRYPANHWALALVVGAGLGFTSAARPKPAGSTSMLSRVGPVITHAVLLLALLAAWWEVAWAGGVDLALVRGQAEFDEASMTKEDVTNGIASLNALLRQRPDDAEARLRVAGLHVVQFRHAARQQLRNELGSGPPDEDLWALTSPAVLHSRAAEFSRMEDTTSLAELRQDSLVREHLLPAVQNAWFARNAGPLLPGTHRLLAELVFLVDDPWNDVAHIERATSLQPQNPELRHWAGRMHWDSGRISEALAEWQRCLSLAADYDDDILARVLEALSPEQITTELLPNSVSSLLRLIDRPEVLAWNSADRKRLGARLREVVQLTLPGGLPPGEWSYAQGRAYQLLGEPELARGHFERAIMAAPGRIDWRLMHASMLHDLGETREAIREVEVCVRLAPDNQTAKLLLDAMIKQQLNRPRRPPP